MYQYCVLRNWLEDGSVNLNMSKYQAFNMDYQYMLCYIWK